MTETPREGTPRPGWYPDPADDVADGYRWWDGTTWTDHTADHAYAPAPDEESALATPRRQPRMVRAVAWTVVVALVLTTSAGALLLLWSGPAPSDGPRPDGVAATVGGQLDAKSRRASIGPVTMDLPAAPYKVLPDTHRVAGLLDPVFFADAMVHRSTDAHISWSALVCLAAVDEDLIEEFDHETAGATVSRLAAKFYGGGRAEIRELDASDHSVDGHSGIRVTAQVHYQLDGLPSRYDDVTAILVQVDDGSVVVAVSSVPDDASEELRTLAATSLASLRIN